MNWKAFLHDFAKKARQNQIDDLDILHAEQFLNQVKDYWNKKSLLKLREEEIARLDKMINMITESRSSETKLADEFINEILNYNNNPPFFIKSLDEIDLD